MNERSHIFDKGACLTETQKQAYIADKLSGIELHVVEKHLLMCEMCADELEGLKLLGIEETKQVAGEINIEIQKRTFPSYSAKTIPLKRWIAYAATLILLFGIGTIVKTMLEPEIPKMQLSQNDAMEVASPEIIENKDIATEELTLTEKSKELSGDKPEIKTQKKSNIKETINSRSFDEETSADKNEDMLEPIAEEIKAEKEIQQPAHVISNVPAMSVEATDSYSEPEYSKKEESSISEVTDRKQKNAKSRQAAPAKAIAEDYNAEMGAASENSLVESARREYNSGNFTSVVSLLSGINDSYPDFFEMQWLLAKSYIELKEFEKSRELLHSVVNSKSPYKKEAQDLINKLDEK